MSRVAVAIMAGILLVAATAAQGEEDEETASFREVFEEQMARVVDQLEARVERVSEGLWVDYLFAENAAEGRRKKFPLGETSREYLVMAMCDSDCYDIDLYLYKGEAEEPLESDVKDDAVPLFITDPLQGDHDVEVKMYDCRAEYCYFAVGIYAYLPE